MKRNFDKKLSLMCGNDDLRPIFDYLIFDKGYIIATDGYILFRQSLKLYNFEDHEISIMNGKAIHKKVFDEILRYDIVSVQENNFVCSKGKIVAKFEMTNLAALELKFPNYEPLLNEAINSKGEINEIGLNINLLSKIKSVTKAENGVVRFKFYQKNRAVLINGIELSYDEEIILLMPTMLN